MPVRAKARFIQPMLLLSTDRLPDDRAKWEYQLKLDGYRAIAFKSANTVQLRSRNDNDFSRRYPAVTRGLANLPNETVLDGEIVAFDEQGRPSFNALQNFGGSHTPIVYYVFDVIVLAGRDLAGETLTRRRALLEEPRDGLEEAHRIVTGKWKLRSSELGQEAGELGPPHGIQCPDLVVVARQADCAQPVDPRRKRQHPLVLVTPAENHADTLRS